MMIGVDGIRGFVVLIPPLVYLAGSTPPLWLWVVVAFLVSSLSALFDPALQAILPELSHDSEVVHATNGLFDSTRRMARIVGPGLISALHGMIPVIHFFTLDAFTFFLSALSVAEVKASASRPQAEVIRLPFKEALSAGWNASRKIPVVRYALFSSSIVWALWALAFNLGLALYVQEEMPGNLAAFGLIIASYGVGNVLSNLWFGSLNIRSPARVMFLGVCVIGLGFIVMGSTQHLWVMMLSAACAAIGGPMDDLSLLSILQKGYSSRDVSRVYRLLLTVCHGSTFLCFLISPWLFHYLPIDRVIQLSGVGMFATGIVGLGCFWGVRQADG